MADTDFELTPNGFQLILTYAQLQEYWGVAVPAECAVMDTITDSGL